MSERDLQSIKEEVKARTDIVEVIGQYTRLKRTGKNWTGLCPFHADKKPSFSVKTDTQYYTCWSCGEKGDVFTFVQKKENLDFVEALEFLARRAGIPFERIQFGGNKERASEREQMLELNGLAVEYFQDRLSNSREARDYLAGRGILKETQDRFQLGYAPPEWEGLAYFLERKRADVPLALKLGLLKTRQQGGSYDTFRNRLIFPIHDINGRVIAFGGRAMGDDPAKYLNSEQSPLFDKSRTLYGLNFARKKIGGDTPAVFVEGYVDVITAHQAGFTQCVATLGTSMTEEHARLLVRYNPRVVICYDGDTAGIKATLRGAGVWESIGIEGAEVRVARLPAGDDPDSLLKRGETAAFQAALDNAIPRVDFQIELALKKHDLRSEEGREEAFREVVPILATIPSLTQRGKHADNLSYLHPLHGRYEPGRVVQQMLADIEMYARSSKDGQSPRDKGYPLTENANRQPLAEEPPPPSYRPPSANQWGESWPMTQNVIRKGETPGFKKGGGKYERWPGKKKEGPASDPTPPPLDAPTLTGAEKAERQLLRALFSPVWRSSILGRLTPDLLVTPEGKQLYAWIAETPADAEGGIDPALMLRRAESLEDTNADVMRVPSNTPDTDSYTVEPDPYATADDPYAVEDDPYAESEGLTVEEEDRSWARTDEYAPPAEGEEYPEDQIYSEEYIGLQSGSDLSVTTEEAAITTDGTKIVPNERKKTKISYYIHELLEDSSFLVPNEYVNEACVSDCIRRLQVRCVERRKQELLDQLQQPGLASEQRRSLMEMYYQLLREQ